MTSIHERIKQIVDELFGGNVSLFCRSIGIKQPTMNTILGERKSKPSYNILVAIINDKALNINPTWLMKGEGEMLNLSISGQNFVDEKLSVKNHFQGSFRGDINASVNRACTPEEEYRLKPAEREDSFIEVLMLRCENDELKREVASLQKQLIAMQERYIKALTGKTGE